MHFFLIISKFLTFVLTTLNNNINDYSNCFTVGSVPDADVSASSAAAAAVVRDELDDIYADKVRT